MDIILLSGSFIVGTFIGWSILNLIFYRSQIPSFINRPSLSFGLGMGVVTLEIFLYYFLKIRLNVLNILIPWIPVAIFGIFFVTLKRASLIKVPEKFSLFEKFLFTGISLEVFLAFARALAKPLESFDSIAIYAIRSKAIYLSGMIPPNFFSEITRLFPNPDYPLLVPLSEVWVYTFLGSLNDLLVKAIFPMYFLSFLVIFFFLLKSFVPRRNALLFTFLLATIPQVNRFAGIGYADLILAYYYSIGTILLYIWMKQRNLRTIVLSGIFCGLAIWTKNEGIVLGLINLILLGVFLINNLGAEKKRSIFGHITAFILIIILISGPWFALKIVVPLDNDLYHFGSMGIKDFGDLAKRLDRIPVILYEFQKQFFGPKKWNLIWILFLTVFLKNFKRSFSADMKYPFLGVVLIMLLYGAAYMMIPVDGPINWYLSTTLSRLFIHFAPLTVFWLALMCREERFI